MKIAQIMTPDPISIDPDDEVHEAIAKMDEANVRHLPVVDGNRLVGIVSDRDLLEAAGWLPGEDAPLETFAEIDSEVRKVADVMRTGAITAHPDDQLVTASLDLLLRGVGSLPVLDDDKQLIGIVTDTDVIHAFLRASWEDLLGPDGDPPISVYMAEEVLTVSPETTIRAASELCRSKHIRHLPVVADGELVGIVSDRDLRWARGREIPDDAAVSSLMTTILRTIRPDALCSHAARLMTEFKISSLPVVEGSQLVSIITSTDLLEHCGNTLWELESFKKVQISS